MKRPVIILPLLLAALSCAAPERVDLLYPKESAPVFPPPPDPPKIAYIAAVSRPSDIGVRSGWFRRMLEWIGGGSPQPLLLRPMGVVAAGDRVFIADADLQVVHLFDLGAPAYRQFFRLPAEWGGRLAYPVAVAADEEGGVFVSDSSLNAIFRYASNGKGVARIGEDLGRVAGIAYDRDRGRLYAVDVGKHRVLVYEMRDREKMARKIGEIGRRGTGLGEFNFPTFATVDAKGRLYVADSLNFRIQVFDPEGKFERVVGRFGNRIGEFFRPKGIAVDPEGNLYVVDSLFDTIQIFNPEGDLLLNFGGSGRSEGEFWLASGIAVEGKRIFVADPYNHRIQIFARLEE